MSRQRRTSAQLKRIIMTSPRVTGSVKYSALPASAQLGRSATPACADSHLQKVLCKKEGRCARPAQKGAQKEISCLSG